MTAALLIAATMLDSMTYLLMGIEHEANPLVAELGPVISLDLRWAATIGLLLAARHLVNPRPFLLVGAVISVIGAVSNLRGLSYSVGLVWL